jgi:hypothetical protein
MIPWNSVTVLFLLVQASKSLRGYLKNILLNYFQIELTPFPLNLSLKLKASAITWQRNL